MRRTKLHKPTLYHESGHVIVLAAFGLTVFDIKISSGDGGGLTQSDRDIHLTKRQQDIIHIAGLAGERIDRKSCGKVVSYKNLLRKIPESISGPGGDLAQIIGDSSVTEEYLNGILKEAWDILQRNKPQFEQLIEHLQKSDVGTRCVGKSLSPRYDGSLIDHPGCMWVFELKDYAHILHRVEAVAEDVPEYVKDVVWQNEKYLADLRRRKKEFQYPTQMPMFPTEVAA